MYDQKIVDVYTKFFSSEKGLSTKQISANRKKYGFNVLKDAHIISPWHIFLNQFKSSIVWILIAAVVISLGIAYFDPVANGESYIDAIVIAIILVMNAFLGFIQEFKAEKSIQALRRMAALKATVKRNGKVIRVDSKDLVPGDILLLEAGDKVPADSRLITAIELQAQEAALTGESTPVSKHNLVISKSVALADQKNMIFSGTAITRGRCTAIVVATGMYSQIGKIAKLIQDQEQVMTPLQKQLAVLGKWLGIITIMICSVVLFAGFLKGGSFKEMFITAISLAVAAIPEGLPAVVTISLALGVKRMISRNALIRKLPSVETLGSTTVICSDKTGTLTHNQMTVTKLFVNNEVVSVSGKGYKTMGRFSQPPKNFSRLLEIGTLCNDANLSKNDVIGDPTEGCLIVSAAKAGLSKVQLEKKNPRTQELPFSSQRKMMTTVHKIGGEKIAYVKGAPDKILDRCTKVEINGKISKLDRHEKILIMHENDKFAEQALRVLGFAYKEVTDKVMEDNLIFVGLQAMIDPPREEAKAAIRKCHTAGIKVVMITGDHVTTARAIAQELGIAGRAITGDQLDSIKDLQKEVDKISVYARVNPEHKLRIVEALQKRGHVVAMTGDGVNDAPALKKADIGIAMGITGTDVAKEASEMILTDDNFTSIVSAVEEGRGIYSNIKKFVYYLLSSNMGEVLTIFLAIIIGFTTEVGALVLPLLATQILWMNLITDGFPALALGVNPTERSAMVHPPRKRNEQILSLYSMILILTTGIVMMLGTLFIFSKFLTSSTATYAQTMAFTTLIMFQMFNVLNYSSHKTIFSIETFRNMWLWLALLASMSLQLVVVYSPWFNTIFHTVPLALQDWTWILTISVSIIVMSELLKIVQNTNMLRSRKKA